MGKEQPEFRGGKPSKLPNEFIYQLRNKGFASSRIKEALEKEYGIIISERMVRKRINQLYKDKGEKKPKLQNHKSLEELEKELKEVAKQAKAVQRLLEEYQKRYIEYDYSELIASRGERW